MSSYDSPHPWRKDLGKYHPDQVRLFTEIKTRLGVKGNVGRTILRLAEVYTKSGPPERRELSFAIGLDIESVQAVLTGYRPFSKVKDKRVRLSQQQGLTLCQLTDTHLNLIADFVEKLPKPYRFHPVTNAYFYSQKEGEYFMPYYYLKPIFTDPFWNPENIPIVPLR